MSVLHVHFQLALGSKGQRAPGALVRLGGLAVYVGAVLPHVAVGHEAGVTHVTLVGLLSCVRPHMDLYLTKVKKSFKALIL